MKSIRLPAAASSYICHIFIQDSTSAVGEGKPGLLFSDVTGYYMRAGASVAVAMTMVTITTLGTYAPDTDAKCGFKLVDDTNMPGLYEIHVPNNCLKTGADAVVLEIKGTGIVPTLLEIQLSTIPADARAVGGTSQTAGDLAALINTVKAKTDMFPDVWYSP